MLNAPLFSGLCSMSVREEIPVTVHISEEESEEKDHGVHEFLFGCEILPRAVKLHRSLCHVYTCKFTVLSERGTSVEQIRRVFEDNLEIIFNISP